MATVFRLPETTWRFELAALLSAGQAAKRIGIERSTLWRWLQTGKIAGVPMPVPGREEMFYGYDPEEVARAKKAEAARLRRLRAGHKERVKNSV